MSPSQVKNKAPTHQRVSIQTQWLARSLKKKKPLSTPVKLTVNAAVMIVVVNLMSPQDVSYAKIEMIVSVISMKTERSTRRIDQVIIIAVATKANVLVTMFITITRVSVVVARVIVHSNITAVVARTALLLSEEVPVSRRARNTQEMSEESLLSTVHHHQRIEIRKKDPPHQRSLPPHPRRSQQHQEREARKREMS